MRRFNWIVPVFVQIALVGYFYLWPWYRDRVDTAEVEALTAELQTSAADIERAIADTPETPRTTDLERLSQLNKKTQILFPRIREIAPKLKGDVGKKFLEAQNRLLTKIDLLGGRIIEIKKKIDELKTK